MDIPEAGYTVGSYRDECSGRAVMTTVGIHLIAADCVPHVSPPGSNDIAAVLPVRGLSIQADDPEPFDRLAAACTEAARLLREHANTATDN